MRLVYGIPHVVAGFVASLIPRCAERGLPEASQAIGVADENGTLVGGMVYHCFDPDAGVIELSVAATDKRWFTRPILYGLFEYPFEQLGCQMVCSRVSADDAALRRMKKAYGFQEHLIPRLFGRGEDGIIFTLTVEQWKSNGFHKEHKRLSNGQT